MFEIYVLVRLLINRVSMIKSTFALNCHTKTLLCAIKRSQEARNDVTNKGAEQICTCIVNDKMASKFERFLNFSKQFLVTL